MTDSDAKTLAEQLERRNKEIEIIERVASQISKTLNLDAIAKTMLISMEEYFGFKHSMILLLDGSESVLKVIATHGYKEEGIGAEVKIGVGVIGMVAKKKKLMRMANLGAQKQYMQAIKQQIQPSEGWRIPYRGQFEGTSVGCRSETCTSRMHGERFSK